MLWFRLRRWERRLLRSGSTERAALLEMFAREMAAVSDPRVSDLMAACYDLSAPGVACKVASLLADRPDQVAPKHLRDLFIKSVTSTHDVRRALVNALRRVHTSNIGVFFEEVAGTGEGATLRAVVEALVQIRDFPRLEKIARSNPRSCVLIAEVRHPADPGTLFGIGRVLGGCSSSAAIEAAESLFLVTLRGTAKGQEAFVRGLRAASPSAADNLFQKTMQNADEEQILALIQLYGTEALQKVVDAWLCRIARVQDKQVAEVPAADGACEEPIAEPQSEPVALTNRLIAVAHVLARKHDTGACRVLVSMMLGPTRVRENAERSLKLLCDSSLQPLLALLGHCDSNVRLKAVEALCTVSFPELLIPIPLREPDEEQLPEETVAGTGSDCVEHSGSIGEETARVLLPLLDHGDKSVKSSVAKAILGSEGWCPTDAAMLVSLLEATGRYMSSTSAASEAAARWLIKHRGAACCYDEKKRSWILELLMTLGKPAVPALVEELRVRRLGPIRVLAVEALGWIGEPDACDSLINVLACESESPALRRAAAQALGMIGDVRAYQPLMDTITIDPMGQRCGTVDRDLIKAAVGALGDLGDRRAFEPLMGILLQDLVRSDGSTPRQELKDAALMGILLQDLVRSDGSTPRQELKDAALKSLKQLGIESKPAWCALLAKNWEALARQKEDAILPLLTVLRQTSGGAVFFAAARALRDVAHSLRGPIWDPYVPEILDLCRGSWWQPRDDLIAVLEYCGSRHAVEALLTLVGDCPREFALPAALAIRNSGQWPLLGRALKDAQLPWVKAFMGDHQAVALLIDSVDTYGLMYLLDHAPDTLRAEDLDRISRIRDGGYLGKTWFEGVRGYEEEDVWVKLDRSPLRSKASAERQRREKQNVGFLSP
ncbi:MAG: hypothetical protein FJ288_14790 [Planctomycetes bacterium]|nr:hypothetical protein [Planctomycetota bacterium]